MVSLIKSPSPMPPGAEPRVGNRPAVQKVTVLTLAEGAYAVHGEFEARSRIGSVILAGISFDAADLIAASSPK